MNRSKFNVEKKNVHESSFLIAGIFFFIVIFEQNYCVFFFLKASADVHYRSFSTDLCTRRCTVIVYSIDTPDFYPAYRYVQVRIRSYSVLYDPIYAPLRGVKIR